MDENKLSDKLKGAAKEVVGQAADDADLEHEGRAQQDKARAEEEAEQKEAEAAEARQEAAGHKGEERSRQQ
ncbi:MAG: CsbD family protein [Acidimicrobiales bacterium]|nr:CsbD family protein [Acidimicrobiales bacterium]